MDIYELMKQVNEWVKEILQDKMEEKYSILTLLMLCQTFKAKVMEQV